MSVPRAVGEARIALFLVDGEVHAIDDRCTHAAASLAAAIAFGISLTAA